MSRRARPQLTLVELLIAMASLAILAAYISGWVQSARTALRRELATEQLTVLSTALDMYHDAFAQWPPDPAQGRRAPIDYLREHCGSRVTIPSTSTDPWGTPWRYLGTAGGHARVTANGGKPIVISAGPDRDFGDQSAPALADNLGSDDPRVVDGTPPRATSPDTRRIPDRSFDPDGQHAPSSAAADTGGTSDPPAPSPAPP